MKDLTIPVPPTGVLEALQHELLLTHPELEKLARLAEEKAINFYVQVQLEEDDV